MPGETAPAFKWTKASGEKASIFQQQWFKLSPYVLGHYFFAGDIRVNAVRLVHLAIAGHAVQQEGNQRELVFFSQVAINLPEFASVFLAHVWGRFHSRKDHLDPASLGALDDLG